MEIEPQVALIVVALLLGIFTGFLFDIYRRIRNVLSPGPIMTALGDLFFWGVITGVTFYSLFKVNAGQVRGYLFVGMAIGLLLYVLYLSDTVIKIFVYLDIYERKIIRSIYWFTKVVSRFWIFRLPRRIYVDACRIYSKIKRK
ncbi:MAG: spore cortex biosynthesis protein YabQ [Thermoanaerobacterales bacterium]|jgi:spore cortex biosynthesis protein YabQ|nr:spore cortex biosynthesis protein YabQ [Thermoanaerobacterales bacterium]